MRRHTIPAPTDAEVLFRAFDALEKGRSVRLQTTRSGLNWHPLPIPSSGAAPVIYAASSGTIHRDGKEVPIPWNRLKLQARTGNQHSRCSYASAYHPHTYAGLSVAVQAWATESTVLFLSDNPYASSGTLLKARVQRLCCTPTFADLVAPALAENDCHPERITLGGEPLRPRVGERLQSLFPKTRFTAVYAAAELGQVMKTRRMDGWYPTIGIQPPYTAYRIAPDGVVHFQSPDGWHSAGDRTDTHAGWLRFLGRGASMANVGGTLVALDEIEECARAIAGVYDAVAKPAPSAVTGQVVGLAIVAHPNHLPSAVLEKVQKNLRRKLPKEAWPRQCYCQALNLQNSKLHTRLSP